MHITFVSSFIPRKCGIATYTRDLAMELQHQGDTVSIIAMDNPIIPLSYSDPVTRTIEQEKIEEYHTGAHFVNTSETEIVHIQHEFGLYGGRDGEFILEFASEITKPLFTTFHTILLTPSANQRRIIQELARLSRKIIVMDEIAKDRIKSIYGIDSSDIDIILHGAPIVDMDNKKAKKLIGFSNKFILLANNLLSRNKGIEYAIEAVAKVSSQIPSLVFLIIGETHPLVKISEGESYRNELIELVKKLHLEKHVVFKNKYVPLEELQLLLAATDVYITPYLDPQQITSGTLSYAIGAGKACISTEYVYAKNILANGRGTLVPFRDKDAIAGAIADLYNKPEKRHNKELKAQALRKEMQWSNVAKKHSSLYTRVLQQERDIKLKTKKFITSPIDIAYLAHLTDSVGIIQHAHHIIPNRKFGYSTDDNARALIVVSHLNNQLSDQIKTNNIPQLINIYLSFLEYAQESDGKFHNFLNFHRNWTDSQDNADTFGKAIWALGVYLYRNKDTTLTQPIHSIFNTSLDQLKHIRDLRTASYSILGLYYYIITYQNKTDKSQAAMSNLITLADFLVEAYTKSSDKEWQWFEDIITYDNFRLPQSLFAAYMVTQNKKYKEVALATLEFITACNFNSKKGYFDFIGQEGWFKKGQSKADYDQQPLEAGGAVEAYIFAAQAVNDKQYVNKALLAFEWFFGSNRNHRYIYDLETKGVHDGLNLRGVNQNEGAESIVCFLMANLSLQQYLKKA